MISLWAIAIICIYVIFAIAIVALVITALFRVVQYHRRVKTLGAKLPIVSFALPASTIVALWWASLHSQNEYSERFTLLFSSSTAEKHKELATSYEHLKATYKILFRTLTAFFVVVLLTALVGILSFR